MRLPKGACNVFKLLHEAVSVWRSWSCDLACHTAWWEGDAVWTQIFTLRMQAEGLTLAVGGKDALRDLIERGRPVLAAHGPYTAAGETFGLPC